MNHAKNIITVYGSFDTMIFFSKIAIQTETTWPLLLVTLS